jgi:hypothetical protein
LDLEKYHQLSVFRTFSLLHLMFGSLHCHTKIQIKFEFGFEPLEFHEVMAHSPLVQRAWTILIEYIPPVGDLVLLAILLECLFSSSLFLLLNLNHLVCVILLLCDSYYVLADHRWRHFRCYGYHCTSSHAQGLLEGTILWLQKWF